MKREKDSFIDFFNGNISIKPRKYAAYFIKRVQAPSKSFVRSNFSDCTCLLYFWNLFSFICLFFSFVLFYICFECFVFLHWTWCPLLSLFVLLYGPAKMQFTSALSSTYTNWLKLLCLCLRLVIKFNILHGINT